MAAIARACPTGPGSAAWKYAPPCLPEVLLPRDHLVRRIEQLLGDRQPGTGATVCFVVAPAGYGKTTLLGQWARQTDLQVVWYHLDAADNDPVTCLRGILRALKSKMPTGVWESERLLARLRTGTLDPEALRRAVALLSLDLRRNAKRPGALILTGLSDLSAQEAGYELIDALLSRPPDKLRLVIESREHPRFHVASLLTQRRLVGLSMDDLKLRPDEFRDLIRQARVTADSAQIQQIEDLCAGWITGVLLATGALLPDFLRLASSERIDRGRVVEYLAREVIARLSAAERAFALRAAVLTTMTPELCIELLGLADARERLLSLEQRTGLITRVEWQAERAVYRFQPFLRQALLAELEATPDGCALRRALHARAGHLLREEGAYEEAAQHFAQAGEFEELVAMIEARRSLLLRSGNGMTLARWIHLLPEATRAERPQLAVLLAELQRLAGNMEEARKAACQASRILASAHVPPHLAARLAIVRGNIALQDGDSAQAAQLSAQALALIADEADEAALSAGLLGVSAVLAMEGPDRALVMLNAVRRRCAGMRDLWREALLHYLHSKILYLRGAFEEAETAAAAALLRAQEAGDEVTAVNARLNLGAIALQRDCLHVAREHLEEAYAQACAAGYVRGQAYAKVNLADLRVYAEDYEGAVTAYQEAWPDVAAAGDAHLRYSMVSNLAFTLTTLGRTMEAIKLLEREIAAPGGRAHDLNWIELAIALGFAYHRAGHSAQARLLLDEARVCAAALDAALKEGRARLYRAAVEVGTDRVKATAELLAAFDALLPLGPDVIRIELRQLEELHPLLWMVHHPLAEAFTAPRADAAPPADLTLAAPEARATAAPSAHTGLPGMQTNTPAVQLFALGEPRVLVGSKQVKHWRKPGVRELLFFLAERGSATTDQVQAALWPDDPPDRSLAAFREARSRLKSALGIGDCVVKENQRWRLCVKVTMDVQEFESLLDDGERHFRDGDLASAATAFRQAMTYWAGPYLDDIYSEWVLPRREALLRRYHDSLERLGKIELRLGRLDDAIQHFYLLLDADPYRESSFRGLMRAFALRGEIGKALDQYDRCLRALEEMDGAPSKETLKLGQVLRARVEALEAAHARRAVGVG